jgi:hypothetical protein
LITGFEIIALAILLTGGAWALGELLAYIMQRMRK